MSRRFILLVALAGIVAASPRVARACTPGCVGVLQASRGSILPVNRPYFRSLYQTMCASEILRADGSTVASSYKVIGGDTVFGPDEPVTTSDRLSYRSRGCCGLESKVEVTFGPASEPPTSLGMLRIEKPALKDTPAGPWLYAMVVLDSTPELQRSWSQVELALEVDGKAVLSDGPQALEECPSCPSRLASAVPTRRGPRRTTRNTTSAAVPIT
jgi:hypothetical protein